MSERQTRVLLSGLVITVAALSVTIGWLLLRNPSETTTNDSNLTSTEQTTGPGDQQTPGPVVEFIDPAAAEDLRPAAPLADDRYEVKEAGGQYYVISPEGPETFTESRSLGFARNEEGAALAAAHIYQRASPVNADWEPTIQEQFTGLGVEQALYQARLLNDEISEEELAQTERSFIAVGWTVDSFTPAEANIELHWIGNLTTEPVWLKAPMTMRWLDDDWRLVIPDQGSFLGLVEVTLDRPQNDLSYLVELTDQ